jgi:MFS family permease
LVVFLVVFIDLLGFGIVLPLLPLYATDLLEPLFPAANQAVLRGALLGLLMSCFSAMQSLFAPVWGRVSDRIGRRPILLLGLCGSVLFYSLFGVASEWGGALGLTLLFAARLGAGVAGATISTAQAVIADCTPPDRRARGMALIGAAFGIGFTFGPLLGLASLLVPRAGAPGFAAAGFSLLALLLALRLLPETLKAESAASLRRRWFDWQGFRNVLKTPAVGVLVGIFSLVTFAFGELESTLALVNKALFGQGEAPQLEITHEGLATERINFLLFAYVGLVLMLVQGLIYRRLVGRVGEVRFLRLGIVLLALGLAGAVAVLALRQEISGRTALLVCALGVLTVSVCGFAFVTPSLQSLISRRSDPAKQGEVLGVNQSGAALARILGPLVASPLFFGTVSHVLPYVLGSLLLAWVWFLSRGIHQD